MRAACSADRSVEAGLRRQMLVIDAHEPSSVRATPAKPLLLIRVTEPSPDRCVLIVRGTGGIGTRRRNGCCSQVQFFLRAGSECWVSAEDCRSGKSAFCKKRAFDPKLNIVPNGKILRYFFYLCEKIFEQ
jgi:hypothetical protein